MVGMIGREERRLGAGEDRFAVYLDKIVSALGAPSSCRLLDREGAMDCSTVGDRHDHAAMATPVTSAQVANAWRRAE